MKGKLIIIEGGDGSGKATQSARLQERLLAEGIDVRKVEFPDYSSPSSALIKMYLNGDFGTDPNSVSPYPASAFYAVDRFASYQTKWKEYYMDGGVVIADRYTTSNMVHQAVKFADRKERKAYLDWLWDFEFNKCGLPIPDCVIFLDIPPAVSLDLITGRDSKSGAAGQDIHERNALYLSRCHENAVMLAHEYGWQQISCVGADGLRDIEAIHKEVYAAAIRAITPAAR